MVDRGGAGGESGGRKLTDHPQGSSSVKWGLQSHVSDGFGLKEVTHGSAWHRASPMEVLRNLWQQGQGAREPGGWGWGVGARF